MLRLVLTVLFIANCVFLAAVILLQEGKSAGLGSIGGMADTYWGKNKSRSMEGKLEKMTKYSVFTWMLLAFVLNLKVF